MASWIRHGMTGMITAVLAAGLLGCASSAEMAAQDESAPDRSGKTDSVTVAAAPEAPSTAHHTGSHVAPDSSELGTLPSPITPARPGLRGPTWRDALEIPVGFFGIWTERQYQRAVSGPGLNGVDLLQQEFDRLSATGATHIMVLLFNEAAHVDAAEEGRLRPGIGVRYAAEWKDRSDVLVHDDRVPGPPYYKPKSTEAIFNRFAIDTDLDSLPVRQDAFDLLDETVESMIARYGDTGAVPFYLGLDEGWGRGKGRKAEQQYDLLFNHYVGKVRSLDTERPIAITQSYPLVKKSALYPWLLDDDTIGSVDSVFSGALMAGWNLFLEDDYPFRPLPGNRTRVLESYAGPYYHRKLFRGQVHYNRELSREVARYADIVQPVGPTPEWWKIIQLHRLENVYPDSTTRLINRRPTTYEYAMQAYMGLACGARGISAYTYVSIPFMGQYTSMAGEVLEPERPLRARDHAYGNSHGLISHAWMSDTDSLSLEEFRAPLSEQFGVADYFPEGTKLEPYPGLHYPWDRMRDLYHNLHELLPIMRDLRYWWATDGLDRAYADVAGEEGRQVVQRRPIRAWMEDTAPVHDDQPLGKRFRLRAITGEDERPLPHGDYYASNVLVGMFDDPADRDHEYYFLVNLSPNAIEGDVVVDNDQPTKATLQFDGVWELEAEVVWFDSDRDPDGDRITAPRGQRRLQQQDIILMPGDAKLLRVRSLPR